MKVNHAVTTNEHFIKTKLMNNVINNYTLMLHRKSTRK